MIPTMNNPLLKKQKEIDKEQASKKLKSRFCFLLKMNLSMSMYTDVSTVTLVIRYTISLNIVVGFLLV